jgi:hypothetical protein
VYAFRHGPRPGHDPAVDGPNPQFGALVAFDGTNYLVAWADDRSGVEDIYARVTQDGVLLDGTGSVATSSATVPARNLIRRDELPDRLAESDPAEVSTALA